MSKLAPEWPNIAFDIGEAQDGSESPTPYATRGRARVNGREISGLMLGTGYVVEAAICVAMERLARGQRGGDLDGTQDGTQRQATASTQQEASSQGRTQENQAETMNEPTTETHQQMRARVLRLDKMSRAERKKFERDSAKLKKQRDRAKR